MNAGGGSSTLDKVGSGALVALCYTLCGQSITFTLVKKNCGVKGEYVGVSSTSTG